MGLFVRNGPGSRRPPGSRGSEQDAGRGPIHADGNSRLQFLRAHSYLEAPEDLLELSPASFFKWEPLDLKGFENFLNNLAVHGSVCLPGVAKRHCSTYQLAGEGRGRVVAPWWRNLALGVSRASFVFVCVRLSLFFRSLFVFVFLLSLSF